MKKFILTYNRKACIGATACVATFAERFKMSKDNKADLISGKLKAGVYVAEIPPELVEKAKAAAASCPASAIKIEEVDE